MARQSKHEALMISALSRNGWHRDLTEVHGAVPTYGEVFRLGYVHAGNGAGRSTTLVDAARIGANGRHNFISLKGHTIRADGKLADDVSLTSGCKHTILAAISAARDGVALPVVHYAAAVNDDGEPDEVGYIMGFDAAQYIRASGMDETVQPLPIGHRWKRGERPAVTLPMGRPLPSGGVYKKHVPNTWVDWTFYPAEDKVQYPSLTFGYNGMGLNRADWTPIHAREIAEWVEARFPWTGAGFRF